MVSWLWIQISVSAYFSDDFIIQLNSTSGQILLRDKFFLYISIDESQWSFSFTKWLTDDGQGVSQVRYIRWTPEALRSRAVELPSSGTYLSLSEASQRRSDEGVSAKYEPIEAHKKLRRVQRINKRLTDRRLDSMASFRTWLIVDIVSLSEILHERRRNWLILELYGFQYKQKIM